MCRNPKEILNEDLEFLHVRKVISSESEPFSAIWPGLKPRLSNQIIGRFDFPFWFVSRQKTNESAILFRFFFSIRILVRIESSIDWSGDRSVVREVGNHYPGVGLWHGSLLCLSFPGLFQVLAHGPGEISEHSVFWWWTELNFIYFASAFGTSSFKTLRESSDVAEQLKMALSPL